MASYAFSTPLPRGSGDPWQLDNQNAYLDYNVNLTMEHFADGLNLDLEGYVPSNLIDNYVDWIKRFNVALKNYGSEFELTMDTATMPNNYVSKVDPYVDSFLIMGYDMSGYHTLTSNAPAPNIAAGVYLYKKMIDVEKIVLIQPWYSYYGMCATGDLFADSCVVIGDKVKQLPYNKLYQQVLSNDSLITSGERWGKDSLTPYINVLTDDNSVIQYQYDNPKSLSGKLSKLGISGAGVWVMDDVNGLPADIASAMWSASRAQA
eukprot:gene10324-12036_t